MLNPTIEMRCPCCAHTQQIRIHDVTPKVTSCTRCKEFLLVTVSVKEKPNNVLMQLSVSQVQHSQPKEKTTLRVA